MDWGSFCKIANFDYSLLVPRYDGKISAFGRHPRHYYELIDFDYAIKLVECKMARVMNQHSICTLYGSMGIRTEILRRDKLTCQYCGEFGDTIDHIVPVSRGGLTTFENCVCACFKCNNKKGNKLLEEMVRL